MTEIRKTQPDYVWPIIMGDNRVALAPGDAVMYYGCEVYHSRDALEGHHQAQATFHYVDQSRSEAEKYKFDKRLALGMSVYTKGAKNFEEAETMYAKQVIQDSMHLLKVSKTR
jgi:hypothetical protein